MESICIKMAGYASLPVWLLDSKESIMKSKEWNIFVRELYQAVDQQLTESHVESFAELSEAERLMFVQRARQAVHDGRSYGNLYQHVTRVLDHDLNRSVSRHQLLGVFADTKTDLILDSALDGSVGLLKKWPDLRVKLHVFLNQPLPLHLQAIAWRLFLEDSTLRKKYEQLSSAKSSTDREILSRCEATLKKESLLVEHVELAGALHAMKSVLSYYHNVNERKSSLHQSYYNLFVPFVWVNSQLLPRKDPTPADVVTLLVEEYFTFTSSLPQFIHKSIAQVKDPALELFISRVLKSLQKISSENSKWIAGSQPVQETNRTNSRNQTTPSKVPEKTVVSVAGPSTAPNDTFKHLVGQLVQNMFVGYANKEVLLYIWDQYIIGLDSAGFTDDYLPAITAVFLNLVVERLKPQEEAEMTGESLSREGKKLTVVQFQFEMNKHFYTELFARLKQESRAAVPVMDPTQGAEYRWHEWFSDPPVSQPEKPQFVKRKIEPAARREDVLPTLVSDEQHDDGLADRLKQERKRREDGEQIAAEEIDRLRRELDEARRLRQKPQSDSPASVVLIAPPPSVNDRVWRMTPPVSLPSPAPQRVSPKQTKEPKQASVDLLRRIAKGFNRLAHGEGYLKQQIDDSTKKSVAVHREDLQNAEVVIFGRELKSGEFQQLPQTVRNQKTQEMLDVIRKRMIDRRQQELNTH